MSNTKKTSKDLFGIRFFTSLIIKSVGVLLDLYVITAPNEKLGGIPYHMKKSFNFIRVIKACGLTDIGYHGNKFT